MRRTTTTIIALMFISAALKAATFLHSGGATFPYQLYKKWFAHYRKSSNTHTYYKPVGSGNGLALLLNKKFDFCGSDIPLDKVKIRQKSQLLQIPTCMGAIAITYNLPSAPRINLTGHLLSEIFLGNIHNWSHKKIQELNPRIKLQNIPITVIHRTEKSGSTLLLTSYLSKMDPHWKNKHGIAKRIRWPIGLSVEGSKNIAQFIKKIPGSISYLSLSYSIKHKLPAAALKNRFGYFTTPDINSISAATPSKHSALAKTSAPNGYPISAFSYLFIYKEQNYQRRSRKRAQAIAELLLWTITKGQQFNRSYFFVPIPKQVALEAQTTLHKLTYQNRPLFYKKRGYH